MIFEFSVHTQTAPTGHLATYSPCAKSLCTLVSNPNGLHRPFSLSNNYFSGYGGSLQLHLEKEELSLESSWESSLEPHPLRAFLASMCHARSCNPSDWYPSSKARTT